MSDTDTPEEASERTTRRWVYLGIHKGQGTRKVASFRTDTDGQASYKVGPWSRGLAVGYIYEVTIDADTRLIGAPQWTGDKADDIDDLRLAARSQELQLERDALERRARTEETPELTELLTHVGDYASKLISTASKDALITLLTKTVWQARRPK